MEERAREVLVRFHHVRVFGVLSTISGNSQSGQLTHCSLERDLEIAEREVDIMSEHDCVIWFINLPAVYSTYEAREAPVDSIPDSCQVTFLRETSVSIRK